MLKEQQSDSRNREQSCSKQEKKKQVCDAYLVDKSGEIKITLWGDDISKIRTGSKILIQNGYTTTFKGEISLSKGKFGNLTAVDDAPEKKSILTEKPTKCRRCGEKLNNGTCTLCEYRKNSGLIDPSAYMGYAGFDGSFAKLRKKQG